MIYNNKSLCEKNKIKLQDYISYICKTQYQYFLNKKNVIGVGCGYKIKNSFRTNNLCIQVFVRKKITKNRLSPYDIIPSIYKGILTDIIETDEFKTCSLTKKIRPVLGGYTISLRSNNYFGTLGCLVTNGVSNFILSTNHLLTDEGEAHIGEPIIEPSYIFSGTYPNDTIATLNKFIPIRPIEGERQPINLTDCGLGLLTKRNIVAAEIALIGRLKGVKKSVKLNEEVKKVGCISELTTGIVNNIHATSIITLKSGRQYLFNDVIVTSSMNQPGDSGAILVNKSGYGVGLLFASSGEHSIYCNLATVLDQLDVKLIT